MFGLIVIGIAAFTSCCCAFSFINLNREGERDVEQPISGANEAPNEHQDPTSGSRPSSAPSDWARGDRDSDLRQ
jgi:hypothetical protein